MSGEDGVGREGKGNDIWHLPVEVMEQAIVPLLDPISLLRFGSSCKAARQLSLKKELWEALLLRYNVPSPLLPSNSNNNEEAVGHLRDAFMERVTSFSGVYYLSERANDNRCNRGSVHFLALAQGEGGSSGSGLVAYQNTFHNDYGGDSTTKYFGTFRVVKDSPPLDDGTMLVLPHSHLELELLVQIQSEEGEDFDKRTLQPPLRRSIVLQRQTKQVVPFFHRPSKNCCCPLQATLMDNNNNNKGRSPVTLSQMVWAMNAHQKARMCSLIKEERTAGSLAYLLPRDTPFNREEG